MKLKHAKEIQKPIRAYTGIIFDKWSTTYLNRPINFIKCQLEE